LPRQFLAEEELDEQAGTLFIRGVGTSQLDPG
jgi:hypothetical protein